MFSRTEADNFFFFSVNGQVVNILGFVGHTFSVTRTQLCGSGMKAAKEDLKMNDHGCDAI